MDAELKTHLVPFLIVCLVAPVYAAWQIAHGAPVGGQGAPLLIYLGLGAAVFGASSIFHAGPGDGPLHEELNKVDHLGIHLMIAGTGSLHMGHLPAIVEGRVPAVLAVLWALAIAGCAYRLALGARVRGWVVYAVYVAMALTVPAAVDWSSPELTSAPMIATFAALVIFGASAAFLFPREHLHPWWHVGTVVGYGVAGDALALAL